MTDHRPRNDLGEFLKARRRELDVQAVGLTSAGTGRRVPGLRREEVAQLAAISTDHYARMEQGKATASGAVLRELARALQLDDAQRGHLLELAGNQATRPRRRADETAHPRLQRLLDDLSAAPALILGRGCDVLGWNCLASALITDFGALPDKRCNYVWLLFTDPVMRTLYVEWEAAARIAVSALRRHATRHPEDPRLINLVGELSVRDTQFRRLWAADQLAGRGSGTVQLRHPDLGDLTLDWDTVVCASSPDQQLLVWTAQPGTPTHDGLRLLASLSASRRTAPRQG